MKKAVIVGSGQVDDASLFNEAKGALLISADGGLEALSRLRLTPDILLGDMDSVSEETLREYEEKGLSPMVFPLEKDLTDMALAAEEAVLRGARKIVFFGATSDERLDHTLANIGLLRALSEKGIEAEIAAPSYRAAVYTKPFFIRGEKGKTVSLLSLSDETVGVTLKGFYYPLHGAVLPFGASLGVSNLVTEDVAEVHFTRGALLAVINRRI